MQPEYIFKQLAQDIKKPYVLTNPWDDLTTLVNSFNRELHAALGHGNIGLMVKRCGTYAEIYLQGGAMGAHVFTDSERRQVAECALRESHACSAELHYFWEKALPYSDKIALIVSENSLDVHMSEEEILSKLEKYFHAKILNAIESQKVSDHLGDPFWLLDIQGGENRDGYPINIYAVHPSIHARFQFTRQLLSRDELGLALASGLRPGGVIHRIVNDSRLVFAQ